MVLKNPNGDRRYKNPKARSRALILLESLDPEVATELKRLFASQARQATRKAK